MAELMTEPAASCKLKINKSVCEVFEAVVNGEMMNQYFISSASGNMIEGADIVWHWDEFNLDVMVKVLKVEQDACIEFEWSAAGSTSMVQLLFESNEDHSATLVRARESGQWAFDQAGVIKAVEQTQGWTHMLLCMKAYLEYGIHLNRGGVWS
jgi:uncharacterized protein YndB with AHSA1/START domain